MLLKSFTPLEQELLFWAGRSALTPGDTRGWQWGCWRRPPSRWKLRGFAGDNDVGLDGVAVAASGAATGQNDHDLACWVFSSRGHLHWGDTRAGSNMPRVLL